VKTPSAEEELELLRERLADAQRMQATGTLAAGLVHDLNNAISAILGLAELAAESMGTQQGRADLVTIAREAVRAGELTHSLLSYARRGSRGRSVIHVDELLDEVEPLISSLVTNRIVLERRGTGNITIEVDAGELRRAIVNLCLNAADAIEGPGRLTIAVGKCNVDAARALWFGIAEGMYATIAVHDTGVGMDEVVRARIFEPFFTTKSGDNGTGLGLSMVLDTVRNHAGAIEVESAPGRGSTFTLYLPISRELRPPRAARGTGNVVRIVKVALVVDEMPRTREVAARVLRGMGMSVVEASDFEEALRVVAARRDDLKLVVIDPELPGLYAPSWIAELRAQTKAPVVLCGIATHETEELLATSDTSCLAKPYRIDDLRLHVERLLGA
jgi:nitrogen-specific signal transduction histidine kinase/CheY-like chemotaxis protein